MRTSPPPAEWAQVGGNVRRIRNRRGMTAQQLAHAAGISRAFLSNIEAGRKHLPADRLDLIAAALKSSKRTLTKTRPSA